MDITKRNARLSDASILLEWRNSPSAREFSQNSELIDAEEHLKWLIGRLERIKLEPFFLFEMEDKLVGMSRLEFESKSTENFMISILVDPEQYGKGIGTMILEITCEVFFGLHPGKAIVAKVHRGNSVSQKLFTNAGFSTQNSLGEFLLFEKRFK